MDNQTPFSEVDNKLSTNVTMDSALLNDATKDSVSVVHQQSNDMSLSKLVASADLVSQMVMLILIILSVWSWAIIVKKIIRFKSLRSSFKRFDQIFWSGQLFEQLYERMKRTVDDPMSAIFVAAMNEFKKNEQNKKLHVDSILKIGQKDRVLQAMNLVRNRESEDIESSLSVLAGIGSYSPFIGLFGTVWGIMHSFQSIAMSKNTNLAVVAPGIAEALLATAIGLIAAIPAVAAYNYLVSQSDYLNNRIDDFITELYTILSRNIDEEKL